MNSFTSLNVDQDIELPTIKAGKSVVLVLLGMGVYLAYLYHVGFEDIGDSLRRVNLVVFSVALLLSLMDVVFNALSWNKLIEQFDFRISFIDVFLIYMSSIFLNNIIPSGSVSGETARVYFLDKIAENARFDSTSATVAATRVITAMPFVMGMSAGLVYLVFYFQVPSWAVTTCFTMIFLIVSVGVIFLGVCMVENWLQRIVNVVIDQIEKVFHWNVDRNLCHVITHQFHRSMNVLRGKNSALIISSFWAFLGWLSLNLVAFLAFRSLGVEVPILAIFAVYSVAIVFQTLPLVLPGGVGLIEILMTSLFTAVGIPLHDAAAVTILSRLAQLWFHTLLGGIATAYLVRRVSSLTKKPVLADGTL